MLTVVTSFRLPCVSTSSLDFVGFLSCELRMNLSLSLLLLKEAGKEWGRMVFSPGGYIRIRFLQKQVQVCVCVLAECINGRSW
jgi:hypothetical protein